MKPLEAYNIFREMHKAIKDVWAAHPPPVTLVDRCGMDKRIEAAFDAVDMTLYLAEGAMVELDANARPEDFK